jgi:hypothetical protein
VQLLLLDLHAVGLSGLEVIAKMTRQGKAIIDDQSDSQSAPPSSMDFIRRTSAGRVAQAVEKVQPRVRKGGGELSCSALKAHCPAAD